MGLNYGFDIFCDHCTLWDFIDSVVELTEHSSASTTLTYGSRQKVVPLWLSDTHSILSLNGPKNDNGLCLSIPFIIDDEIQNYLKETQDKFLKQNPQSEPWEPQFDSQGRVYIGCIYFYIVTDLEAMGREGYGADLVGFDFRAATNGMSRLFQTSQSIQQTFVDLAKKHDAVYCLFSSGGSDQAKVLWLDGQECSVNIPEDWLPMSQVRQIVSSSRAPL